MNLKEAMRIWREALYHLFVVLVLALVGLAAWRIVYPLVAESQNLAPLSAFCLCAMLIVLLMVGYHSISFLELSLKPAYLWWRHRKNLRQIEREFGEAFWVPVPSSKRAEE